MSFLDQCAQSLQLHAPPSTATFAGSFIISNAALGIGTLNFPAAFAKSGGLPFGIPILLACGFLALVSLCLCAYAMWESQTVEYFQGVRHYCGPRLEMFLILTLIVSNFGTCILFMVVIGDQSETIMVKIFGVDTYCDKWYLKRYLWMVVFSLACIYPVCLARNLDFLKYPSIVGVLSMLYLVIVIVIDYFAKGNSGAIIDHGPEHAGDIFLGLPTILLGFQCMTNAYPVFASLKNPSSQNYLLCALGAVFINTLVYLPVAMFGYLKNGRNVNSNVLLSYSSDNNMIFVAQIAVLMAVMMSYPTMFVVAKEGIDKVWQRARKTADQKYRASKHLERRRYVITTAWLLITLGTALAIPNIGIAISFTGSIASFFFLVFPGAFILQTTYMDENGIDVCATDGASHLRSRHLSEEESEASLIHKESLADKFKREKTRNGKLCWTARICGLLFIALGFFVFGLGFSQALIDAANPTQEIQSFHC